MPERKSSIYKSSTISYLRFGSGPKLLFCFHGYGEQAEAFTFLSSYIGDQCTLFAVDLPCHGQTQWREGSDFTPEDLANIIQQILAEHAAAPNTQFSLLGFSLGCRVALSLYQHMPHLVERMVLLAPDGLKVNRWYWLATQTWAGNKFFAFTMKKPFWFFGLLKLLNKLKLVNTSIFKFVNYYIGDAEVRRLLYTRWTTLRKLKPNLAPIKELVRQQHTPVRLVYGTHDRIILSSVGERFKKDIEAYCTLTIIPAGHQVLHEKHVEDIVAALLH